MTAAGQEQATATFLRVSAWLAMQLGLSRDEFVQWALVAWRQEIARNE